MSKKIKTVNLHGREHPTYSGVLNEAHKIGLKSIEVTVLQYPSDSNAYVCICSATVKMKDDTLFTEIGDASPRNTNKMIVPHLIRMAATRAKGRALRDAINVGEALREEIE